MSKTLSWVFPLGLLSLLVLLLCMSSRHVQEPIPVPEEDCYGNWVWWGEDAERIVINLQPNGIWTAKNNKNPGLFDHIVTKYKGKWYVQSNRLVILQTHYWVSVE